MRPYLPPGAAAGDEPAQDGTPVCRAPDAAAGVQITETDARRAAGDRSGGLSDVKTSHFMDGARKLPYVVRLNNHL